MKIERVYFENGVKVTRYEAKRRTDLVLGITQWPATDPLLGPDCKVTVSTSGGPLYWLPYWARQVRHD